MRAPREPYQDFARHYDLHGWDSFASSYGPRLQRYLEEKGLARCRVLDAGCGTGTLALGLAGLGHKVAGMDLSSAMLEVARSKDAAGAVAWRQADLTRFDLRDLGLFDLVTCVGETLNQLESLDSWERAFRLFAAHLRPGGRVLLDVMTCRGLQRLDRIAVTDHDGLALILSIAYEPAAHRSTIKATSFVSSGNGRLYERAAETVTAWGQPVGGVLDRLGRAGFESPERPWSEAVDPEVEDRLILFASRT